MYYISPNSSIFEFQTWGVGNVLLSILFFALGIVVMVLFFKFLKSYTAKDNSKFILENTNLPLETIYNKNNSNSLTSSLSEYDLKVLNLNKNSSDIIFIAVNVFIALFIWFSNSFGG